MLHPYENISDAMAKAAKMDFPLLVAVINKADNGNSETKSADEEYINEHMYVPITAAEKGEKISKADATKNDNMKINPTFDFGKLKTGEVQRKAISEILVRYNNISSVCLVHFLEEGSPNYQFFISALPPQVSTQSPGENPIQNIFPRIYYFPPPKQIATLGPMAASYMLIYNNNNNNNNNVKALLTPKYLAEVVYFSVINASVGNSAEARRMPPLLPATATATPRINVSPALALLKTQIATLTDAMTAEARQWSSPSSATTHSSAQSPGADYNHSEDNATATAAAARHPQNYIARQHSAALQHILYLAPFLQREKKKAFLLMNPNMTLATVFKDVQAACAATVRETSEALRTASTNANTMYLKEKASSPFSLQYEQGETKKETVVIKNEAEAAAVPFTSLTANTLIRVAFQGYEEEEREEAAEKAKAPSTTSALASATTEPKSTQKVNPAGTAPTSGGSQAARGNIVCDGDVCRVVPFSDPKVNEEEENENENEKKETAKEESKASSSQSQSQSQAQAVIQIRCSLPSGETEIIPSLPTATATLAAAVRPVITNKHLHHSHFLFVQAYPPKRFSMEEEKNKTLAELGMVKSAALRVVLTEGAPAAAAPPPKNEMAGAQNGDTSASSQPAPGSMGMLKNWLSNGLLRRQNQSNNNNDNTRPPQQQQQQQQQQHAPVHSMAEYLAQKQEAERREAAENLEREKMMEEMEKHLRSMQQQQQPSSPDTDNNNNNKQPQERKSNRYFGGTSTEFIMPSSENNKKSNNGNNDKDNNNNNNNNDKKDKGSNEKKQE